MPPRSVDPVLAAPRAHQASTPPDPSSRYELLEKIAAGGMATVYVGRQRGAEGFWRLVAIKRPHQHLLDDPAFRRMFVDEARLASKIHHPNVVPVLDVEERPGGQLLLVMDYVEGASLAELMEAAVSTGRPMPTRNAVRIVLDALAGLHAAHELTDAAGRPLRLVHRDVSPHNVLVGVDGTARVADFGIAKSVATRNVTESGVLKGKLAYMAPEYVEHQVCDARSDVFAMAAVLWEAIAGRRLFRGDSDYDTLRRIVAEEAPPLSSAAPWTHGALDAVLAAALDRDASARSASARAFADALEAVARRHDLVATPGEVGDHVRASVAARLAARRERLRLVLEAAGTTGPMDAAHVALARDLAPGVAPAVAPAVPAAAASADALVVAPSVAPAVAVAPAADPAPRTSDAEGASLGAIVPAAPPEGTRRAAEVAGAAPRTGPEDAPSSELTERALVAAGIRPSRRSAGGVVTVIAVVLLGAGAGSWLLGSRYLDADAPALHGERPTSPASPTADGHADPVVVPLDGSASSGRTDGPPGPASPSSGRTDGPPPSANPSSGRTDGPPPSTNPSSGRSDGPRSPAATPPSAPPPSGAGPLRANPYR